MFLVKIDMSLRTIKNIVTTCLCLHNLCIIHCDEFDWNLTKNKNEWDTDANVGKSVSHAELCLLAFQYRGSLG